MALSGRGGAFAERTADTGPRLLYTLGSTPGGDDLLAWVVKGGGRRQVLALSAAPGHGFGRRVRLSTRVPEGPPVLVTGAGRKALVYWSETSKDLSATLLAAAYYRP